MSVGTYISSNNYVPTEIELQSERRKMPCYEPNIRLASDIRLTKNGKPAMLEYINSKGDKFRTYEYYEAMNREFKRKGVAAEYQRIPCGQCIGCKEDYAKQWATRCCLEAMQWEQNWFLTLTYDDYHKPWDDTFVNPETGIIYQDDGTWNGYLEAKDFTKFMKDLRRHWEYNYNHTGIRFYGCGEYGGQGERPHYHIILFNMPLDPNKLRVHHMEKATGDITYKCEEIEQIWKKGFITIAPFSYQTACYVAGYVQKKQKSCRNTEWYAEKGQTPEFTRMSRMPGIGKDYYLNHPEMYANDEIIVCGAKQQIVPAKIPRYFDKMHEEQFPDLMDNLKQNRKQRAIDASRTKMKQTSLTIQEQLQLEKKEKEDKLKIFKERGHFY